MTMKVYRVFHYNTDAQQLYALDDFPIEDRECGDEIAYANAYGFMVGYLKTVFSDNFTKRVEVLEDLRGDGVASFSVRADGIHYTRVAMHIYRVPAEIPSEVA